MAQDAVLFTDMRNAISVDKPSVWVYEHVADYLEVCCCRHRLLLVLAELFRIEFGVPLLINVLCMLDGRVLLCCG